MNDRLRDVLHVLVFIVVVTLIWIAIPVQAQSYRFDCAAREGIDRARCERHERMYAECAAVKGEAHFACDRAFLLANPLDCKRLDAEHARQCEAEAAAFRVCEAKPGREFLRCVRDEIRASPMGPH